MLTCLLAFITLAAAVTAPEAVVAQVPVAAGAQAGVEQLPTRLGRDEQLTLVIHSAEDCPVCKAWRESPSGLAVATRLAQRSPLLHVVFIERKKLNGSESESLYASQLQYMYAARQERYQLSPPVPLFEISAWQAGRRSASRSASVVRKCCSGRAAVGRQS